MPRLDRLGAPQRIVAQPPRGPLVPTTAPYVPSRMPATSGARAPDSQRVKRIRAPRVPLPFTRTPRQVLPLPLPRFHKPKPWLQQRPDQLGFPSVLRQPRSKLPQFTMPKWGPSQVLRLPGGSGRTRPWEQPATPSLPPKPRPRAPLDAAASPRSTLLEAERSAREDADYFRRKLNGLTAQTVRRLGQVYAQGGRELAQRVRAIIDQYGGEATWALNAPLNAATRAARLQAILQQADAALQRMIDAAQQETLKSALQSYRMTYAGASWVLDQQLPQGVTISAPLIPHEAVVAAVTAPYGQDGLDFFQRFGEQRLAFASRVQRAIGLSQVQGETVSQATSRLLRELGVPVGGPVPVGQRRRAAAQALQIPLRNAGLTPRKHAEMIARTELSRSSNAGALEVYQRNADVLEAREWVATRDRRTCPICISRDGQSWALEDKTAPTIPAHPLCRCTWVPVVKSWAELGLSGLDDDPLMRAKPRKTYAQWAAEHNLSDEQDGGLRRQRGRRLTRTPSTQEAVVQRARLREGRSVLPTSGPAPRPVKAHLRDQPLRDEALMLYLRSVPDDGFLQVDRIFGRLNTRPPFVLKGSKAERKQARKLVKHAIKHPDDYPLERVHEDDDIVATKETLQKKTVMGFLATPEDQIEPPIMAWWKGRYYVLNGHHRTVSFFARKGKRVPAYVVDVKKELG